MGSLCRPYPVRQMLGQQRHCTERPPGAAALRHTTRPPRCPSATLPARHAARTTVSASASGRGGSAIRSAEPGQCLRPFGSPRVSTAEVRDTVQDRLGTDRVALLGPTESAATGEGSPPAPAHSGKGPMFYTFSSDERVLISENHYVYIFSF